MSQGLNYNSINFKYFCIETKVGALLKNGSMTIHSIYMILHWDFVGYLVKIFKIFPNGNTTQNSTLSHCFICTY